MDLGDLDHPGFRALGGTGLGYGLILLALTVALFLVPYLVFAAS